MQDAARVTRVAEIPVAAALIEHRHRQTQLARANRSRQARQSATHDHKIPLQIVPLTFRVPKRWLWQERSNPSIKEHDD
jgi:hypothetical protein